MKNINVFLTSLLLIVSCASSGDYYPKNSNRLSPLEQDGKKRISSKRPSPIESIEDKYIFGNLNDDHQNISDNFLDDNGDYVGKYKIGSPYEISGITYHPREYDNFEEIGTASWYGDDFHGKLTANGEIYHKGDMTAAHPTLPLPSMVRITNLGNGKSVIVRVNDRGPFSKNRIADVSEKAASDLGFKDKGTANVKLEFLPEDTEELLKNLKINQK